jgi:hypothetical protein
MGRLVAIARPTGYAGLCRDQLVSWPGLYREMSLDSVEPRSGSLVEQRPLGSVAHAGQ